MAGAAVAALAISGTTEALSLLNRLVRFDCREFREPGKEARREEEGGGVEVRMCLLHMFKPKPSVRSTAYSARHKSERISGTWEWNSYLGEHADVLQCVNGDSSAVLNDCLGQVYRWTCKQASQLYRVPWCT